MEFRLIRWNRPMPPSEADLRRIYQQEGLSPYAWSNGAGDIYAVHTHAYHKILYTLRGSITWILPDLGKEFDTEAGDRIDLPAGTRHAARVGSAGVVCLEAYRYPDKEDA